MEKKNSVFKASLTFLKIVFILLQSIFALLWRFKKDDAQTNRALNVYIRKQARRLLSTMGISVHQRGEKLLDQRCLLVSNHVSWIDILVIVSRTSGRFIAKAEVGKYPLIGHLAKSLQTLFLNRASIKDAIAISKTVSDALEQGGCIVFFPEGTTSDGKGLLPLHPSLFESAVMAKVNVQPMVLRFYRSGSMAADMAPAFVGEKTLVSTLWEVLRTKELEVLISGLPVITPGAQDTRRSLCDSVQKAMEEELCRLDSLKEIDTPMDEDGLKAAFFVDVTAAILQGVKACDLLSKNNSERETILDLRQSFHIIKNRALMIGCNNFYDAAFGCQNCLDSWIKAKQPLSEALITFLNHALQQLLSDLDLVKSGKPSLLNFEELTHAAKKLTYASGGK